GKDVRVAAAAVEIVLAGSEVRQHRRDAARDRGATFGDGIVSEGAIDTDVRVCVDDTGKGELAATIVAATDLRGGNLRRHPRDAATVTADVGALDARDGGAHDPNVLDHEVEDLRHVARIAPFTRDRVKTRASLTGPARPDSVGGLQIRREVGRWISRQRPWQQRCGTSASHQSSSSAIA